MKKTFLLLGFALILSCSSPNDVPSDTSSSISDLDSKIDIPTWLIGQYKADNLIIQYPYPQSRPYSINFLSNDIIIKGTLKSEVISLQTFINKLKVDNQLISVEEVNNQWQNRSYKLTIEYKHIINKDITYACRMIYEIKTLVNTGKMNINYTLWENGGSLGDDPTPYTKQ